MQKQIWRYTDSQNTSGQKNYFLFIKKLSLQQHLISNLNRFKFDKFQYRFGMSRQLWKADFQIQVWQKIQTLNPANPGMALLLQPARSLGKLFFQSNSLALLSGVGFYVEKCHIRVSVSGEAINFGISIPESQKGKHCALGIWLWSFLFFFVVFFNFKFWLKKLWDKCMIFHFCIFWFEPTPKVTKELFCTHIFHLILSDLIQFSIKADVVQFD